ncbi:helix-turn-helix domain-containing protein [Sporosarcina sp. FA9]|uniref:helix-turn-helix domain-containing protein n=1 Tax=Sporosarcina sp. FA9 TaxID=3413030 RepID=UPI003F65F1DD
MGSEISFLYSFVLKKPITLESGQIATIKQACHSNRDIARHLSRAHQTIANEPKAWKTYTT